MAASFLTRATSSSATIKVIDVSDRPDAANVVRDGRNVPVITVRPEIADTIVAKDLLDVRQVQQRVLSQSVAPGTRVARGTVVDIVLVNKAVVPVATFEGTHLDLAQQTLDIVAAPYFADDTIRQAVFATESYAQLPAETQTALVNIAREHGVTVDAGQPGRRPEELFETLRIASTFSI
jgi:hypothetical protein